MNDIDPANNSNQSTTGKEKNENNRIKSFFPLIPIFLAAIAGLIFYFTIWKVKDQTKEAKKVMKKIKARYKKTDTASKEENAFDLYNEAALKLKELDRDQVISKIEYEGVDKHISETRELTERCSPSLELVKKAYKIKHFQVPEKYNGLDQDNGFKSPDFLAFRKLAQFLAIAADYDAINKQKMEAAKKYLQAIYMGTGIGSLSTAVSKMINISIWAISLKHLRSFLLSYNHPPEVYSYIIKEMLTHKGKESSSKALLDAFLYGGLIRFDFLKKQKMRNPESNQLKNFYYEREKNAAMIVYKELLRLDSLPFKKAYEGMSKKRIQQMSPKITPLTVMNFESYQRAFAQTKVSDTVFNGTIILAAIMLYRSEHGKYPSKLSDLKGKILPEIPRDDLAKDGKFIYKNKNGKVIFYSVGFNTKDDGGKEDLIKSLPWTTDILFLKNN